MLDHVGFCVSNFEASLAFYAKALAPLGFKPMMEVTPEMTGTNARHMGFGAGKPDFWISIGKPAQSGIHVAFAAKDRAAVDAFYKAALAAGGTDNGPPGLRPHYHQHYYGAFVRDPDGNNIEAVCHTLA
jgi:catechol 2,3-dioxygenase-like lactoylglutathione lyase family enzyme